MQYAQQILLLTQEYSLLHAFGKSPDFRFILTGAFRESLVALCLLVGGYSCGLQFRIYTGFLVIELLDQKHDLCGCQKRGLFCPLLFHSNRGERGGATVKMPFHTIPPAQGKVPDLKTFVSAFCNA
jgi:hypothetical protein